MDKLDQFFKEKFQKREFEFQDAYWQEAEKMIQQDKRNKRMLWWWRLSGLFLLILLMVVGIWWFSGPTIAEKNLVLLPHTELERESTTNGDGSNLEIESKKVDEKGEGGENVTSKSILEADNRERGQEVEKEEDVARNFIPEEKGSGLGKEGNGRVEEGEKVEKVEGVEEGEKVEVVEEGEERGRDQEIEKEEDLAGNLIPGLEGEKEKEDRSKSLQGDVEIDESKPEVKLDSPLRQVERFESDQNNKQKYFAPFSFLSFNLKPINSEHSLILKVGDPLVLKHLDQYKAASKFGMSFDFRAPFYPYSGGENVLLIGWSTGLNLNYKLAGHLRLETALRFRKRRGAFNKVDETSVFYYGFGRSESTFNLIPNSLYYLEVPLGISRSFGYHQLEIGAVSAYLMGVRGNLKNVLNPELPQELITESKGWLEEDGFKKWHWDVYLEYGFQYNRKIRYTIGLNYTPGKIIDQQFNPGQDFILKESRPLFIDLGVSYKLF